MKSIQNQNGTSLVTVLIAVFTAGMIVSLFFQGSSYLHKTAVAKYKHIEASVRAKQISKNLLLSNSQCLCNLKNIKIPANFQPDTTVDIGKLDVYKKVNGGCQSPSNVLTTSNQDSGFLVEKIFISDVEKISDSTYSAMLNVQLPKKETVVMSPIISNELVFSVTPFGGKLTISKCIGDPDGLIGIVDIDGIVHSAPTTTLLNPGESSKTIDIPLSSEIKEIVVNSTCMTSKISGTTSTHITFQNAAGGELLKSNLCYVELLEANTKREYGTSSTFPIPSRTRKIKLTVDFSAETTGPAERNGYIQVYGIK